MSMEIWSSGACKRRHPVVGGGDVVVRGAPEEGAVDTTSASPSISLADSTHLPDLAGFALMCSYRGDGVVLEKMASSPVSSSRVYGVGISSSRCFLEFGTCDVLAILPLLLSAERWPSQPHDGGCSSLRRDADAEDLRLLRAHLRAGPPEVVYPWRQPSWISRGVCLIGAVEKDSNSVLQIFFMVLVVKVWIMVV